MTNKKLTRTTDPNHRVLLGVLGGFAEYFNLNQYLFLIRLIYVIFTILTIHLLGLGIILYFLMAIIIPSDMSNSFHHFKGNDNSSDNGNGRKVLHNVHEEDEHRN